MGLIWRDGGLMDTILSEDPDKDEHDDIVNEFQTQAFLTPNKIRAMEQIGHRFQPAGDAGIQEVLAGLGANLPEVMQALGYERTAAKMTIDATAKNEGARYTDTRHAKYLEWRIKLIDNFMDNITDPGALKTYAESVLQFEQSEPLAQATFSDKLKEGYVQAWGATKQLIEQAETVAGKFPDADKLDQSATVRLQALGYIPVSDDPVEQFEVNRVRTAIMRDNPKLYETVQKGMLYREQHPIKSMGADFIVYAPLVLAENAIFPAGGTAVNVAQNAALAAVEAYIFTPGDGETRTMAGGIGALAGGGLTAVLDPLGRAAARAWKGRAVKKAIEEAAEDGTAPGTALSPPITNRIALAKMLRITHTSLMHESEAEARSVISAVRDGLVDAQTVSDLFNLARSRDSRFIQTSVGVIDSDSMSPIGVISRYVNEVRKEAKPIPGINVEHPIVPGHKAPGIFRARATARARESGHYLADRFKHDGISARQASRIAKSMLRLGAKPDVVAHLSGDTTSDAFREAIKDYALRQSSEIQAQVSRKMRSVHEKFSFLQIEDIDHAATRLHDMILEAKLRGIDMQVDYNIVDTIARTVDADIAAAHGLQAGSEVMLRGSAKTVISTAKGGFNGKTSSPIFRVAIDLFADPRPGRLAETNIHEMSHVYLNALEYLNPDQYNRLAGEVAEMYKRMLGKEVIGNVKDPLRVAELFAELLTNHTLINEVTSVEGTFLDQMARKFGRWVSGLLDNVRKWKQGFIKDSTDVGHFDHAQTWSNELRTVADKFARSDWRGIMDDLAVETPRKKATGKPFSQTSYDTITLDDAQEILRQRVAVSNKIALLRPAADEGNKSAKAKMRRLIKKEAALRKQEEAARRSLGKQHSMGAGRHFKEIYTTEDLGIGDKKVAVRTDVRPPLMRGFQQIDWKKIARAFLSNAVVSSEDGVTVRVRDRVRQMALWYEKSNEGAHVLLEKMREIAKTLPGYRKEYWDAMTPRKVMSYIAVNGASRSPSQNLRNAIQWMVYNQHFPGGHMMLDGAKSTLDDATRGNIVHLLDSYSDSEAIEALTILADWGVTKAQAVLSNPGHPGFPRVGQTFDDWLRATSMTEFDGTLKLASYERNIAGHEDTVTNDIWQFRFFLWNDPERNAAIYALGDGNVDAYRRTMDDAYVRGNAARAEASAKTKEAEELRQLVGTETDPDRALRLYRKIDRLEAAAAKKSDRGARFKNDLEKKWKAYTPNQGEYFLMEDAQFKLADYLNEETNDTFWTGKRVQSVIWGLMRGRTSGGTALFDESAVSNFLTESAALIDGVGDDGVNKLLSIMRSASDAGTGDAGRDIFARTAQEFGAASRIVGDNHVHNKLSRAVIYRASQTPKGQRQLADTLGNMTTSSGKFTVDVAKSMGLKGTRRFMSAGFYEGEHALNTEIRFQGTAAQAGRMGDLHSALNFQAAREFAAVESVGPLGAKGFDPAADEITGLIFNFPNAHSAAEADTAFRAFYYDLAEAAGRSDNPASVLAGATSYFEGGMGRARITLFPGAADFDAIFENLPTMARRHGVSIDGWKGVAEYVDYGQDLIDAGGAWLSEWNRLAEKSSVAERGGQPGSARAVQAAASERGDLVAARALWRGLQGLDETQRREMLRHYALSQRARLTEVTALYDNPVEGARAVGAHITKADVLQQAKIANGSVLNKLWEIEKATVNATNGNYEPVVTKQMIDDAVSDIARWKGKEKLPSEVKGYLTQVRNRLGRLGVDKDNRPRVFAETLTAKDAAEIAELRASEAAMRFDIAGDTERAASLREVADRSRRTAEFVSYLAPDTSPAEGVMARGLATTGKDMVRAGMSAIRHFYRATFKNRFEPINDISPEISNQFNVTLAADIEARQIASRLTQQVMGDLTDDQREIVERFLQSEKAKVALSRVGGDRNQLGEGMRNLLLEPAHEREILSDPAIAAAIERHKTIAQPEMERILIEIDPDNADHLLNTESGAFMPSIRFNPDIHRAGVRTTQRGGTSSVASRFNLPKNTASTRRFSGAGDEYILDYEEALRWKLNRDLSVLRQRQLIEAMEQSEYAVPAVRGQRAPNPIQINGKEVRWKRVRVSEKPTWVRVGDEAAGEQSRNVMSRFEEYWLPIPMAKAFEEEIVRSEVKAFGQRNVWHKFADFTTAAMLATVAEATRHSIRVLSMLSRVPRPLGNGNALEMLVPYFGVRFNRLHEMMNVYNRPEALHYERWLARINALPGRAFDEVDQLLQPSTGRFGKALNVAKGLVHKGRGFLFDLPEIEASGWRTGPLGAPVPARLWGFDVRARLVAADMFVTHLKATGRVADDVSIEMLSKSGNEFDAELREFMTQFGQFNTNIQTRIVQWARKTRLNPFAGSQGGFRAAEFETFFGFDRLPKQGVPPKLRAWYSAQVIYGGWLGYMTMLTLGNKALSGKWPWENQEGHEFDLDIGLRDKDGAPTYISGNLLEPSFMRGARQVGVKALFDERGGRTITDRAANWVASGRAGQEVFSFVAGGPPVQSAMIAATGHAPYLTGEGKMLRVAPKRGSAKSQALQNLTTAAVNMNANFAQLSADQLSTTRHAQDPMLRWSFEAGHVVLGKIGGIGKAPIIEAGNLARIRNKNISDLAWQALSRYNSAPNPTEKNHVYQEYLSEFRASDRAVARQQFWGMYQGLRRSQFKRAAESRLMRESDE